MNNVKLNGEQIEELKGLYKKGCLWLAKDLAEEDEEVSMVYAYFSQPKKSDKYWVTGNTDKYHATYSDYNFLSWEDETPFYFGDLFKVVYKGEVE